MANEKIKERLKGTRKKYGYTQQNVADILGIKRATYAKYENGQSVPPIAVFIRLATLYGVNVDYLSGRETNVRNVLADSSDEEENRIKFFNFFLSMSDEQKNSTLNYMEELLRTNESGENTD